MKQLQLPNGCSASQPSIFPKNWKTITASIKQDWRIQYYFRDPQYLLKYPNGKLVIVKQMNKFESLAERRAATAIILDTVKKALNEGYNPILKTTVVNLKNSAYEISPETTLIPALKMAMAKLKIGKDTHDNVRRAFTYIEKSSDSLGYSSMEVSKISRKHISLILNNCPKIKDHWSPSQYNHYRSYLMMLFTKLVELEAVESNPVNKDLPKEMEETNLRALLTPEERKKISEHYKHDKYFNRFLHIFFHSGARPIELTRLKDNAIDPELNFYKIKVRKRKRVVEERRPIKTIVKHLWKEILDEIKDNSLEDIFLFGSMGKQYLLPAKKPLTKYYLSKKWNREVKKKLNIKKDLYSLKHLNLDETAALLDAGAAAKQAGHKSKVITLKHYLINETERENTKLREVNNPF